VIETIFIATPENLCVISRDASLYFALEVRTRENFIAWEKIVVVYFI